MSGEARSRAIRGLRANALAAVIMLLLETALGIGVNVYVTLPGSDSGASVLSGFGRAVTNGPAAVVLHATLGLLLIVTALTAVVRSVRIANSVWVTITSVNLVVIVGAAMSGARFVGTEADGASLSMGIGACLAIAGYVVILFLTPHPPGGTGASDEPH
ncbi:MAG: hypothetical protein JWR52_754 [Marmoricola sp.]|nr:hypothetical protein [Marmoricola sp.]